MMNGETTHFTRVCVRVCLIGTNLTAKVVAVRHLNSLHTHARPSERPPTRKSLGFMNSINRIRRKTQFPPKTARNSHWFGGASSRTAATSHTLTPPDTRYFPLPPHTTFVLCTRAHTPISVACVRVHPYRDLEMLKLFRLCIINMFIYIFMAGTQAQCPTISSTTARVYNNTAHGQ